MYCTLILQFFPENFKGYEVIFLQEIHFQTGIRLLLGMVDIDILKFMEFLGTLLVKYNCVYLLDITVTEFLALLSFYPLVLPEQQICRITGAPLPRIIGKCCFNKLAIKIPPM